MKRLQEATAFGERSPSEHLGTQSVRGGITTLSSQATLFGLQMVGTVILARLLTPNDYGLVGMVAVVVGFARMFRDAGLTSATVQRASVTREQMSTLFWVNLGFVTLLGCAMALGAPAIARFYGRSELVAITLVLAGAFVVNGLSIQHDALLKRHMRFDAIATGQILAQVLNISAAILLAFLGFGYWALVAGTCVTALVTTVFSVSVFPWIPGRYRRGTGIRGMIKYGGDVMGFNFVDYFARNADNIMIGKYSGADELGLYSKAYSLFLLPLQQIRGPMVDVAMPALSSLRSEPERYRRYYQRLVDSVSTLSVPIAMFCLVEADFLVRTLLGSGWSGVVPIFRVLAVFGVIAAADGTRGVVLLSHGYSRRHLTWGLINAVVTVSAFAAGIRYGAIGVAVAYAIVSYVLLLPSLMYCFAHTPVTVAIFMRGLLPSVGAGIVAAGVAVVLRMWLGFDSTPATLTSCFAFCVVYIVVSASRGSFRDNVTRVVSELPIARNRGGATK